MAYSILLIEDNVDNLELMTYLLNAFGHSTLVAENGAAGLEIARREKPDLIVCDIQMPGMSGYEVARALQAEGGLAGIPRIAVTAMAMVGDREKILAAGFDGYIAKPIVPEDFVPLVEKYVRGAPPGHAAPGRAAQPATRIAERKPAPNPSGSTILVVDDSPANLSLAHSILEPCGHRVIEASNACEALAVAHRDRPELILCDVHMRGGDGYDCVRAIKADPDLCHIPVVFLTSALFGGQVREKCMSLGATRFFLRPVDPGMLIEEIRQVLEESRTGTSAGGPHA